MGKLQVFSIVLRKDDPVYFSGETIVGKIDCRVKGRIKLNHLRLDAKGTGRVQWLGVAGRGKSKIPYYFTAREKYLDVTVPFLNNQSRREPMYLDAGDYSFPFEIELPLNVPGSFECTYGRIRYTLIGILDVVGGFNKLTQKIITVINHIDLNMYPTIQQPTTMSLTKTACCCCCRSGPIDVTLILPRTGYVSGDFLSATIIIDNQSSRDVRPPVISLHETVLLNTRRKKTSHSRELVNYTMSRPTRAYSVETYANVGFIVPPICPTSISAFRLIELDYVFYLTISTGKLSINDEIKVPILIGTIPLAQNAVPQQHHQHHQTQTQHRYPASSEQSNYNQTNYFGSGGQGSREIVELPDRQAFMQSQQYPYYDQSNGGSSAYHDSRV